MIISSLLADINFGSDFFNQINSMLSNLITDFQKDSMSMFSVAKKISLIGLAVHLLWIVSVPLSGGGAIDPKKVGRILLVIMGVFFYTEFLTIINEPLNLINNGLGTIADISEQKNDWYYDSQLNTENKKNAQNMPFINKEDSNGLVKEMSETLIGEAPSEATLDFYGKGINYVNSGISKFSKIAKGVFTYGSIFKTIEQGIVEGVYEFFIFIGKISATLLNTTRAFLLISLSLLGIVVIALCAFPGLEGSFLKWLQFYITVYIWVGIAHLLRFVLSGLYMKIKDISGAEGAEQMTSVLIENKFILPVALAAIAGNAMIPKLANMLIQTGVSGVGASLNKSQKGGSSKTLGKLSGN